MCYVYINENHDTLKKSSNVEVSYQIRIKTGTDPKKKNQGRGGLT